MSNVHRIAWIDTQIRYHKYPNCSSISEEFCISLRQAARDIEYLRDSMGAPIEYSRTHKGYYYTRSTYVLGHILMTDQQRQGLLYLAEQYAKMETEHARHLARLFRRLIDNSNSEEADLALPLFPIDAEQLNNFDTINKAIQSYTKVDIGFVLENGLNKSVRLSPYKIYTYQNENYVVGYCEPDKQIRLFSLNGRLSVTLTDVKFDLTPLLKQAEVVPELVNEPNIAYVRLDSEAYAGTLPFQFQCVESGLYRIEYYDPQKLLTALFSCPTGVSIQSPSWLRNLYINHLKRKLLHLLQDDTICPGTPVKINDKQADRPDFIRLG